MPYPEEMANAARPKPPSWVPVVVLTFLIAPLGLISAVRRAGKARRGRNDRHPYWIAFGATMAVGMVAWSVAVAIFAPVYFSFREEVATKALESNVVGTTKGVSSATCQPVGERGADGLRAYRCTVKLTNDRSRTLQVKADADGRPAAE